MFYHLHKYKFEANISNGHKHMLMGYTDNIIGLNMLHFHFFSGVCSYNGHTHYFSGFTGLPIRTENGHVHRMEGYLEFNSQHEHKFNSFTFEDIEYMNDIGCRRWAIGNK